MRLRGYLHANFECESGTFLYRGVRRFGVEFFEFLQLVGFGSCTPWTRESR